jgi:mercuric ion transport protein
MKENLDKLPAFGAVIAAAGCPVCFPALAAVGSVFGIGALAAYESQLIILTQIFVILSMVFAVVSYRRTQYKPSLIIALVSGVLIFGTWYLFWNPVIVYLGLAGISGVAVWNIILENRIRACRI